MNKHTFVRRVRPILLTAVLSIGTLVGASPASAQFSMFRGMQTRPTMTAGDLNRHGKLLRLTPEQADAAKELLASYTAEFEAASKDRREKMREISEEFQETRDFSVMKQMEPVTEKFDKRSAELETVLLGDIKSLLDEGQLALWPKFERTRRREKSIDRGMVAGESVDLVRIIHDLELSDEARKPLADVIEQYESDLDRVLTERNKVMDEQDKLMPRPGAGGGGIEINLESMEEATRKVRDAGIKVREVNQRYARNVEGLLSEDIKPKFLAAVKQDSFPQVYRPSRTARSFEAALKFDDLDASQKEAIRTLQEQFKRDAEVASEKWAQAILEEEASGKGNIGFGGMLINLGDENEETPVSTARKAKRDVDKKALDSLKTLLNEKQVERLPKRDEALEAEVGGARMMLRMDSGR